MFAFRNLPTRIIGVGGAGVAIVGGRVHRRARHVESVIIDRDEQALARSPADITLRVALRKPQGLDNGGRPAHGRTAIDGCRDEVLDIVRGTHLAVVVAGLGGGTGTSGAPEVARLARSAGTLTLAVVTRPFSFEGRRRNGQASAGMRDIAGACDALIVVPHDAVVDLVGSSMPYRHILAIADAAVATVVDTFARIAALPAGELVCVGLADIRAVFQSCGPGAVGIGVASGPDRARTAAAHALASPLLRDVDLRCAGGAIVQVAAADPHMGEVNEAMDLVRGVVGDDTLMFFADARVPELGAALRVTVVAAGTLPPRR
jgi:cell division protein FtsZ